MEESSGLFQSSKNVHLLLTYITVLFDVLEGSGTTHILVSFKIIDKLSISLTQRGLLPISAEINQKVYIPVHV